MYVSKAIPACREQDRQMRGLFIFSVMLEYGAVKYFFARGVGDLSPYMCVNDFIKSRTLETGPVRTMTLAQGDKVCDFLYTQGRRVTQDWSTGRG
jgi:hypothetical protein